MPRAALKKTKRTPKSKALPLRPSGPSVAHGHTLHFDNAPHAQGNAKNQRMIMWLGVSVVMVAIVTAWILNLNQMLGPDAFSVQSASSEDNVELESLRDDLKSALTEVQEGLGNFEELSKPTSTAVPTSTVEPNTLPN